DNELTRLAKEGIISVENAVLKSSNPERLRKSLSNLGHGA
ncbi:twitching motility protein PilT, partial [Dehalococcoides mccartyi]